jgi:hypothetical protein
MVLPGGKPWANRISACIADVIFARIPGLKIKVIVATKNVNGLGKVNGSGRKWSVILITASTSRTVRKTGRDKTQTTGESIAAETSNIANGIVSFRSAGMRGGGHVLQRWTRQVLFLMLNQEHTNFYLEIRILQRWTR